MADLDLEVLISRGLLGEDDLSINDYVRYYVTPDFLGAQVNWNTVRVGSPWVDGEVTVSRTRGMVEEKVTVEVFGDTQGELQANLDELVAAFIQSDFTMQVNIGSDNSIAFACEAASYTVPRSGPRLIAGQQIVAFVVPRQPAQLLRLA